MRNYTIRHEDGVAIITWDVPKKSHNVMSWEGFEELHTLIQKSLSNESIIGIVITSGKSTFSLGMDLNILQDLGNLKGSSHEVLQSMHSIHDKFRKIELAEGNPQKAIPGKPIVTAINGSCLGIGYEIALASHRIICANNQKAIIGLPEIKVGLFPGAGGTTRLSRRLGLLASSAFILQGKTPNPEKALQAGLIDEVVLPEDLIKRAKEWVLKAKPEELIKSWDKPREKIPGGRPYDKNGFLTFVGASAMAAGQSQNVYPAIKYALASIYEGFMVPFDQAIKIEARWFTKLLLNPSSSAMINSVFINRKVIENGALRPKVIEHKTFKNIGVIGAGMMGSGIALVAAKQGLKVNLMDTDPEKVQAAIKNIKAILTSEKSRDQLSDEEFQRILSNINPIENYEDLHTNQLVIEAVFEDPKIKQTVLQKISANVKPDCIIASNTSTIPITFLSEYVNNPSRFIGLHFFSPVHKMSLLEIIRGKATSDQTAGWAFDFSRSIRKTPIIVNDKRFFYANRCVIPYINEGVTMVGEGIKPALIENASRQIGMPVGALQLIDETSLELAVQIAKATEEALGSKYQVSEADRVVLKLAELGRLGRKANAGFYDYGSDGKRQGLWSGLQKLFPHSANQPNISVVKNRLLLTQIVEAIQCLEDGVLNDVREGDVAAIYGWGFAPWSGGPFRWVDNTGVDQAISLCETYSKRFGKRFTAPKILYKLQANNGKFYNVPKQAA